MLGPSASPTAVGDAGDALARHLRDRRLLLLLDNFEHVLEAAPAMVCRDDVGREAPRDEPHAPASGDGARLPGVAARRRQTRPTTVERLLQCESVALFVSRARSARSDFAVTAGNARAVAEICTALDRPAAGNRARRHAGRRSRRRLCWSGSAASEPAQGRRARRTGATAHASAATIEWSYELLEPHDQNLFLRLAVFAGGCTLEAAESVCGDGLDVVDGLASLTDCGLIRVEGTDEAPRFAMLETIREYAAERLEESGEVEELRRRHADYFLGLAEEAEPNLRGSPGDWLDRLEREHDNFRAALDRLEAVGRRRDLALRLAAALWRFWYLKGHLAEGRQRLECVLLTDGRPTAARAKASTEQP